MAKAGTQAEPRGSGVMGMPGLTHQAAPVASRSVRRCAPDLPVYDARVLRRPGYARRL
jgi:hypothetical protein